MAGRPLKFKTLEDLQYKIDDYFSNTKIEDLTITGLALHLDTSRQTLLEYEGEVEGREEKAVIFADAIKKAKLRVENSYEIDLKRSGRTGTIFALKNFDWRDKVENELSNPDGNLKTIIINKSHDGNDQSS